MDNFAILLVALCLDFKLDLNAQSGTYSQSTPLRICASNELMFERSAALGKRETLQLGNSQSVWPAPVFVCLQIGTTIVCRKPPAMNTKVNSPRA